MSFVSYAFRRMRILFCVAAISWGEFRLFRVSCCVSGCWCGVVWWQWHLRHLLRPSRGVDSAQARRRTRAAPSATRSRAGVKSSYRTAICLPALRRVVLLDDLGDDARADRSPTLPDGEAKALVHGDRLDQFDLHLDVVTGHHHLDALGQLCDTRDVSGAEVELRPVAGEERGVASTLLLLQHVD